MRAFHAVCILFAGYAACLAISAGEFGHAPDYSWIEGQLLWNDLEGGSWVIRFAAEKDAANDKYGGGFEFVNGEKALKDCKDGEWVRLTGRPSGKNAISFPVCRSEYEIVAVKRLAPPAEQRLNAAQARWVAEFNRLSARGLRYPEDFLPAAKEWTEVRDDARRFRRMFFVIEHRETEAHMTFFVPSLIDVSATAREAVEEHIQAPTGNYLHSFAKTAPERIVKARTHDFYHCFETDCLTQDGTRYHMLYLVLRPGFLEKVQDRIVLPLEDGRGQSGSQLLRLGPTARADAKRFTEAADLLIYLGTGGANPTRGTLVERSAKETAEAFTWTGIFVISTRGPLAPTDWKFVRCTLSVNRKFGKVEVEKNESAGKEEDPGRDEGAGRLKDGRPAPSRDFETVRGALARELTTGGRVNASFSANVQALRGGSCAGAAEMDDTKLVEKFLRRAYAHHGHIHHFESVREIKVTAQEFFLMYEAVISYTDPHTRQPPVTEAVRGMVFRPDAIRRMWVSPSYWFEFGIKRDVVLGETALKDLEAFERMADLLAVLMGFPQKQGIAGVKRTTVEETSGHFRWVATGRYPFEVHPPMPEVGQGLYQPMVLPPGRKCEQAVEFLIAAHKKTGILEVTIGPKGPVHPQFPDDRWKKKTVLTPAPLPPERAVLYDAAEHLAWNGRGFFDHFPPVQTLPLQQPLLPESSRRWPVLPNVLKHKLEWAIIDDPHEAKTALEGELNRENQWLNQARSGHPADYKWPGFIPQTAGQAASTALFHRFEVEGELAGEKSRRTYLVCRPAFLARGSGVLWAGGPVLTYVTEEERKHREAMRGSSPAPVHVRKAMQDEADTRNNLGVILSEQARADAVLFSAALDLFAYLMLAADCGYVLDRAVDFPNLRWTAVVAQVPNNFGRPKIDERDQWRFELLHLVVDRATGKLRLEKAPLPAAYRLPPQ